MVSWLVLVGQACRVHRDPPTCRPAAPNTALRPSLHFCLQTEDRPVVKERVEYVKEHVPVEKEYVVRSGWGGDLGGGGRGPQVVMNDKWCAGRVWRWRRSMCGVQGGGLAGACQGCWGALAQAEGPPRVRKMSDGSVRVRRSAACWRAQGKCHMSSTQCSAAALLCTALPSIALCCAVQHCTAMYGMCAGSHASCPASILLLALTCAMLTTLQVETRATGAEREGVGHTEHLGTQVGGHSYFV